MREDFDLTGKEGGGMRRELRGEEGQRWRVATSINKYLSTYIFIYVNYLEIHDALFLYMWWWRDEAQMEEES